MQLPEWYKGGYPDVEKLMRSLFEPQFVDVNVVSWLPKPDTYQAQLAAGKSYLRTYRTGGTINRDQNRDEPRVQFAALTGSRDDSWALVEFCRQVLEAFADAAVIPDTPHKLHCAGEVVGPQLIPELLQDDRLVPITFELHTWRPKGLPNYRQALGL